MAEFSDFVDPVINLGAEPLLGTDPARPGGEILGDAETLQVAADAAGLTGYTFAGNTLSEMNRLRDYLFERAGYPGTMADWAIVSDRWLFSQWPTFNLSGMRDVRAIVEGAGATAQVDAVVSKDNGEQTLAPGETTTYGGFTVEIEDGMELALAFLSFRIEGTPGNGIDADSIIGDKSYFAVISQFVDGPGSFIIRTGPNPPSNVASPFVISYEFKNTTAQPLRVLSRSIIFTFRKSVDAADYDARVITRTGSAWRALTIPKLEVSAGDATVEQVASVLGTDSGMAYWSARTFPVGIINYASYASPAELWNRQQWNDAANFPGEGTPPIGATSRPRTLITSEPSNAAVARHWLPPAATSQRLFPDSTRAAAAWPDYYEIEFTVPDTLQPAAAITLSPYRFNFEPALEVIHPDRCAFYEIALEATPELERFVTWNNFQSDRTLAKSYATAEYSGQAYASGTRASHGTQSFEHFHDQRIVSEDGGKFWYRDAFTVLGADLAQKLRRFPAWTIERDGDAFTLKLLVPEHDIVVGYQVDGTPITQATTYWPSGTVTPDDYRDHYLQHGGLFLGTWPDFIQPFRFFNTALDGPIAGWTVDKTIGGAWEPGQRLKLYLPKCTTRSATTPFHIRRQTALDANVARTQSILLPSYAGPSGTSLIYNLQMRRQKRRFATLVFRNRQCQLATEATDLRLFVPNQQDIEERPPLYDWPAVTDWRDISFAPEPFVDGRGTLVNMGKELNMGDFYFDEDTRTIHLNRTDALPDDGDEFLLVTASFEAGSSAECGAHFGYLLDGSVPETFVPLRECTIATSNNASQSNFYFNSHAQHVTEENPNGNTLSPQWILHEVWPVAYQRQFAAVTVGVTPTDYTYTVPASDGYDHSIEGKLIQVTAPEDATLTHEIGWRAKIFCTYAQINERHDLYGSGLTVSGQTLQSGELALEGTAARWQNQFWNHATGEQLTPIVAGDGTITLVDGSAIEPATSTVIRIQNDRYATTETNVLQGTHYLHPRTARTTDADRYGRVFHFRLLSARQNWRVDAAWREVFPDPVSQPEIIGVPFTAHFNETLRLLRAWVEAGKP